MCRQPDGRPREIELLITAVLLLAGLYVGWNIGANDAANCIGTTVGSGIVSFRKAVLLMAVCVVAGAVFQGHHVMNTIGKGIVICDPMNFVSPEKIAELDTIMKKIETLREREGDPAEWTARKEALQREIAAETAARQPADHGSRFPDGKLPDLAILVALVSAGLFVTLATFSSIPVSTSQAIVGGVLGVGIGMVGCDTSYFDLRVLQKILGCWVICPFLTMMLSFLCYKLLGLVIGRIGGVQHCSRPLAFLVILSAGYVSYSLGMNDVGNAIGPLLSKYPDKGPHLAAFGGVALAIGAVTFGRRVTVTVGKRITPLDLPGALAAQLSAASGVFMFSLMGIPVSTSQAIVGAVVGVGLVKGTKAVRKGKIVEIVVGWVASPLCAALFAAFAYRLLSGLFQGG